LVTRGNAAHLEVAMEEVVKYCGTDIIITTAVTFALVLIGIVAKSIVSGFDL